MAFVITSPCIEEKAADCVDVCPVDCIEEGEDHYYIDPSVCIECGACVVACPVEAIVDETELTTETEHFLEKANEFYHFFNHGKLISPLYLFKASYGV